MPVYSLIAITRTATAAAASKRICKEILASGGVVCNIENWGNQPVAQPIRKHKQWHTQGHWFRLTYAASPIVVQKISSALRTDETVIRTVCEKLGNTSIAQFGCKKDIIPTAPSS